jgi:site-specific recombinase XerC
VASWIEQQGRELAAPTVKQYLAAIRHLFYWLVTGQIVPANPAASVCGPRHVVRVGKTLVLEPAKARALLDSIDASAPAGLRDPAPWPADGSHSPAPGQCTHDDSAAGTSC